MGMIQEAIDSAINFGDHRRIPVTLMTCQANGLCSYASGLLEPREQVLSTSAPVYLAADGLEYVFSDRTAKVDGSDTVNRFAANQADSINLAVKNGLTPGDPGVYDRIEITLLTWGGGHIIVNVSEQGTVLCGAGPALAATEGQALYVVALDAPK